MKRLLTGTLLVLLGVSAAVGAPIVQRGPRNLGKAPRGARVTRPPSGRVPIQEVIEGFYVSRVQRELDLDDNQFARLLPALRSSLGVCRELAPSNQESTTYEASLVCKLLILGCRILIPDRLLEERNALGQRRTRAFNALRRALREDRTTDEELDGLVRELDEAESRLRAVQQELLKNVDPELSSRQRARMRIIQPNVEERIRSLIERSRNPNRPPPPGGPGR